MGGATLGIKVVGAVWMRSGHSDEAWSRVDRAFILPLDVYQINITIWIDEIDARTTC